MTYTYPLKSYSGLIVLEFSQFPTFSFISQTFTFSTKCFYQSDLVLLNCLIFSHLQPRTKLVKVYSKNKNFVLMKNFIVISMRK